MKKKNVGEGISYSNSEWNFHKIDPKAFDDHLKKSVPFYSEGHELILRLSDFFLPDKSTCYELGCSNGNLINSIANKHANRNVEFIGIDNSKKLIDEANSRKKNKNLKFNYADLNAIKLKKSDLILSYYTIQFIQPRYRQDLIQKIYNSLNWGGCFIMFEKIRANDARFQDIWTSVYNDFKTEKGYSDKEINNKSRSLRGVLEPFSINGNLDMLRRSGFVDIEQVMTYIPFSGFLAIK
tara:strand:+ start:245 stop:958 length:714 start_codon:yes stop_codon:yes gene_type:complete